MWGLEANLATDLVWIALLLRGDSNAVSHLQKLAAQVATTMITDNLVKSDYLRLQHPWAQILDIDPLSCDAKEGSTAVVLHPQVVVDRGFPGCHADVAADPLDELYEFVLDVCPNDGVRWKVFFHCFGTHDDEAVGERWVIRNKESLES